MVMMVEGGDGGGDGGTNYDDDIISVGPGPENGKSCTLVVLLGMEGTPLVNLGTEVAIT